MPGFAQLDACLSHLKSTSTNWEENEASVATENTAHESSDSPSTTEEFLEVLQPYIESGDDEAMVNEAVKSTVIWADDLVPDNTESTEKAEDSSANTETESTNAVESSSKGKEQSEPVQVSWTVILKNEVLNALPKDQNLKQVILMTMTVIELCWEDQRD